MARLLDACGYDKEYRNEANPAPADIRTAVAHVENSPSIKEIVITGGDRS